MADRVRVAMVGTGNIFNQHIPVLRHYRDQVEVVALCDGNAEMLQSAEAKYKVGRTFSSVDDLMAWGEYDAAYVLVSVKAVADVAERFVRAKTPTFLEKPPGMYSQDTARLARAVDETGTPTQVGFNRRFYTTNLAGRAALLETGPVLSVNVHADENIDRIWTNPRFNDDVRRRWSYANGIHAWDLLRYFGGDVKSVESHFVRRRHPMPDSFTAYLEFESGAIGRGLCDYFAPQGGGHRYQVRTEDATLTSYEGHTRLVLERRDKDPVEFGLTGDDTVLKPGFPGETLAFLELVRSGGQPTFPAVNIHDAVATMRMIDAIIRIDDWPAK